MSARESLLSPDWYRVAFMRPRLRPGVRVARHSVRGETWYVLSDPVSGRHHRFNDIAYGLIAGCDGERTLDDVWALRCEAEGEVAPTQGQAIHVYSQAFAANLFVGDVAPDAAAIIKAQTRTESRRRRASMNPLAFRLPLWDPDRALARSATALGWLFGTAAQRLVLCIALLGGALLLVNADDFAAYGQAHLGSGRMLLVLWLVYPAIKALHEFAHACAVKVYGGAVHEVGVTLLFLTPVPYVDASASVAFESKRHRIVVAAAGIAIEAVLATAALLLWLLLEPGLAKEVAFAVAFVGGVSTVLVNGNPLLRFDGYHVLCDAFELPNLAPRSTRWWQTAWQRGLLRLRHVPSAPTAAGEWPWLCAFAPLSWLYRAVLTLLLALMAAQVAAPLGVVVLALGLWQLALSPLLATLRWAAASPEASGHRLRAAVAGSAALAIVATAMLALPLPQRTFVPAVVWLPDDAIVRLGVDGFIDAILVQDGQTVQPGTPVARLSNDLLRGELVKVEAQLEQRKVERASNFANDDALRTVLLDDEIARLAAERERLAVRVAQLELRAAVAGRVVIDLQRNRIGEYLEQGRPLAYVLPDGAPLVRALVRNEDIALVRERPGTVSVQLAHDGAVAWPVVVAQAVPKASAALPTAALTDGYGGSIEADTVVDRSGRTAREPRFQLDLRLPQGADARIGARALVTFRHGDATAAQLVARLARQSFLRHFER